MTPASRPRLADFELIETQADLESLAQELMTKKVLAFDTEADSFYHYFDKTCLVQVATRSQIYLIDPLAIGGPEHLSPLAPVFASPDIRVLFHAAEYDIFVLKRDCGFEFQNLFDTMISAQLLGYPSVGLASIAERQLPGFHPTARRGVPSTPGFTPPHAGGVPEGSRGVEDPRRNEPQQPTAP